MPQEPVEVRLVVEIGYLSISIENILHITACEFIQLFISGKDNDGNFGATQHGKFKSLLEQSILSFEKCYLHHISPQAHELWNVQLDYDHP